MITDNQLAALKQELEGSCLLLDVALERLEIDASAEEAEDRLLDGQGSIERCVGCGWWHESAVMEMSDEHNGPVCAQCCPERFE